jgi:hypothetical protein
MTSICDVVLKRKPDPRAQGIRAELVGLDTCSAAGIIANDSTPVLKLCRRLVAAGHDPAATLEVYRGAVLALTVKSIGEGAGLTVEDDTLGRPKFRRWRGPRGSGAAPPIARREVPATLLPWTEAAE